MAHYTGPKARINRRFGTLIFEDNGSVKAFERRGDTPPGMARGRRGKRSNYGLSLAEKQKIKYYYGLGERHLRNLFIKAKRTGENAGEQLLLLCERRLDNVVRRAGFALTRPQARQGVAHGHFELNGVRTDVPSCQVSVGDQIRVKNRPKLVEYYRGILSEQATQPADWLTCDPENLMFTVSRLPTREDVSLPVEVGMVVELLSR